MLEFIAAACAGLFAGAAIFITIVHHPAAAKLGDETAVPENPQLLERWGRMHGVRSLLSSVAFLIFLAG